MKKEVNLDELIEEYIELSTLHGEYLLNSDVRKNNNTCKKLAKVSHILKENKEFAEYAFPIIMKSENYSARTVGAVDALRTKLPSLEAEAVQVLEEGKDRNDILGFGTSFALENYKKGRLM